MNREKTSIKYITKVKYLGYGFYEKKDGILGFRPHEDSVNRFKDKLREIANRSNGKSYNWARI